MRSMKLVRSFGFAAGLVMLATGASADTDAQLAEKLVQLVERGASIVQESQNDCNAMGDRLGKLADDNADLIRRAHERGDKMSASERADMETRYRPRLEAAAAKAAGGLRKCMSNPKVQDAIRKAK